MALTVGDRTVRPLTADEVMRMVEAGILAEDEPVELLHGVLTEVSAKTPEHEELKMRLVRWLDSTAEGHRIRIEGALAVPDRTSLPEPDIAVVEPGSYLAAHPASALLVVEVAVSSLGTDTRIKPALYAAAGVPELWVVDVAARRLIVLRDPGPAGYAHETILGASDRAEPLRLALAPLELADLFRGL
jgi:Uma2 family endonuclease